MIGTRANVFTKKSWIFLAYPFILNIMKIKNNHKQTSESIKSQQGLTRSKTQVAFLSEKDIPRTIPAYALGNIDVLQLLSKLPKSALFDLVVTSPPYNVGKAYEKRQPFDQYMEWQISVIDAILPRLKETGSLCWQVGNYIENGSIEPLDIYLHPIFRERGLILRNRIIWHFGHGLHCKKRFSGRYEVILWYTKSEDYTFNLDAVRIPSKYPGKRSYKGPNAGKLSSNPNGKNPEDVWDIPNVKGNHVEKTSHPCQFPVGLIERLLLALTKEEHVLFDPFCGVGSAGVAAAVHRRHFLGCDIVKEYIDTAKARIEDALTDKCYYRPHTRPIYDHRKSPLSIQPHALVNLERNKRDGPEWHFHKQ